MSREKPPCKLLHNESISKPKIPSISKYQYLVINRCVSGQTLSAAMVNAGLTTFSKIEQTNPRELELVSLCDV